MSKSAPIFRPRTRLAWLHALALAGVLWVVLIAGGVMAVRAVMEGRVPVIHAAFSDQSSSGNP